MILQVAREMLSWREIIIFIQPAQAVRASMTARKYLHNPSRIRYHQQA